MPWPAEAIADADDVAVHIEHGGVVIDSREPLRYAGKVEPIDAVAGHIPGAINMPFTDNLADGQWLGAPQLAERFARLDMDPQAIVYCGSGVTACHNALAVESAGRPLPRVRVRRPTAPARLRRLLVGLVKRPPTTSSHRRDIGLTAELLKKFLAPGLQIPQARTESRR